MDIKLHETVRLKSIDDLLELQAGMEEVCSAMIDKYRKTLKIYIDMGLPFIFGRNKYGELVFDIVCPI